MSPQIIGLHDWFQTPVGRYLLAWESARVDAAVVDIFGYHALQLGLPALNALHANRMPHQWLATQVQSGTEGNVKAALVSDFSALPFPANSLDLVVLAHTLELSADPHTTLREVERVLVPEGRVLICGLNPHSLWGLRQQWGRVMRRFCAGPQFLPDCGELIAYARLRDWLRLLGLELEEQHFGCYRPAVHSQAWLQRFAWMDFLGARWWPIFGAAYMVVAVKRVKGMRLLEPAWKAAPARVAKSVQIAGRTQRTEEKDV